MGDLSSSLVWSLFAFLFERLITMMNAITATRQKAGVSWIWTHGRSYGYFKLCQTYRRIPEFQPGSRRLFPFQNRPQVYQASCSSGPAPCSYTLSLGERSHTLNLCQRLLYRQTPWKDRRHALAFSVCQELHLLYNHVCLWNVGQMVEIVDKLLQYRDKYW